MESRKVEVRWWCGGGEDEPEPKGGKKGPPQGIKKDMVGRDRPSCPWHLGHAIHAGVCGAAGRPGRAWRHGIGFWARN